MKLTEHEVCVLLYLARKDKPVWRKTMVDELSHPDSKSGRHGVNASAAPMIAHNWTKRLREAGLVVQCNYHGYREGGIMRYYGLTSEGRRKVAALGKSETAC